MTETLIKIQAGTFSADQLDSMHLDTQVFLDAHNDHNNNFDDYSDELYGGDYYGEGYSDDDYGIGDHRVIQKTLSKKQKKVGNKQLSSIITAQVNNQKKR